MSDLIDREQEIDEIMSLIEEPDDDFNEGVRNFAVVIYQLPSAQPQRKTGKWLEGQCSICGCDIPAYIIDWKWQKDMDANFCPSCGADMRGETDE